MIQASKTPLEGWTVKNDMKYVSWVSRGTTSAGDVSEFRIPARLGMDLGSLPPTLKPNCLHAFERLCPPDFLFLLRYRLDRQVKSLFSARW